MSSIRISNKELLYKVVLFNKQVEIIRKDHKSPLDVPTTALANFLVDADHLASSILVALVKQDFELYAKIRWLLTCRLERATKLVEELGYTSAHALRQAEVEVTYDNMPEFDKEFKARMKLFATILESTT